MLKLKCTKHPRYSGKESPHASCMACIAIHEIRLRALSNRITVVEPQHLAEPVEPRKNHWGAL